jgi:hypothetical protein
VIVGGPLPGLLDQRPRALPSGPTEQPFQALHPLP